MNDMDDMVYHIHGVDELCRICDNLLKTGSLICNIEEHGELFAMLFMISSKEKKGIHSRKSQVLCCCC